MDENKAKEKTYPIELTKEQIAIIKAGLQYYWLDDEFGLHMWVAMPGACIGSKDDRYAIKVGEIYKKLNLLTRVKPEYGLWCDIKGLAKLLKKEYQKYKRECEEEEQRMHEEHFRREEMSNEIDEILGVNQIKYGLC